MIFGCAGADLTKAETAFFGAADPLGFILFQRNCHDPGQVKGLVDALRAAVGRADAPVLIDQEGGHVSRLKPPHWEARPAPGTLAALTAGDGEAARESAREAVWLCARLIAHDLWELGITVNCTPVLDLPAAGADPVIGDRALGSGAEQVSRLGRACCEGLLAGGVLPVIKHIPGHGRATVDSHKSLPVVRASAQDLARTDFAPFRALADMPWAMTAHVVYEAVDPDHPATTSGAVIAEVIRGDIGFDGVLVSDDLSMEALSGGFRERAAAVLAAGCDLALHCNGDVDEMTAVAEGASGLSDATRARLGRAAAFRHPPQEFDAAAAAARLGQLVPEG